MDRSLARDRLEDALELAELAERMVRERLRREMPSATEAEIEARLVEWLHERPGAPDGDAVGRKVTLPRGR
jgi:hypothetical protein